MSTATSSSLVLEAPLSPSLPESPTDGELSLKRVVSSLQVLLASRRAARSQEHAYWYTIARGM
jgi:hypothetical protein